MEIGKFEYCNPLHKPDYYIISVYI